MTSHISGGLQVAEKGTEINNTKAYFMLQYERMTFTRLG